MATFEETSEYIRNKFWDFLETYQEVVNDEEPTLFYIQQLQSMREEDKTTMYVDYEHLSAFDAELAELVQVSPIYHFTSASLERRKDFMKIPLAKTAHADVGSPSRRQRPVAAMCPRLLLRSSTM